MPSPHILISQRGGKKAVGLYSFALLFFWLQNVCVGIPGERAPHHTQCQSFGVLLRRSSSPVGDVTVPTPTTTTTHQVSMDEYFMSVQHTSPSKTKQSGHETAPQRTVPDTHRSRTWLHFQQYHREKVFQR
jgi:hypothetical protein